MVLYYCTVDKQNLFLTQTPQVFSREIIIKAYKYNLSATDDSSLVEKLSIKIKTNEGMGFIGQGEGIITYSVVTLKNKGEAV